MIRRTFSLIALALVCSVARAADAPAKPVAKPAEKPAEKPAAPAVPEALKKAQEFALAGKFDEAAKLLRTEAGNGSAEAANALGEFYLAGRGVKASAPEALRWFQKAADAAFPAGLYSVASLLSHGAEGVPADGAKAKFLMRSAAEAGSPDAQFTMGQAAENAANDKPGTPDFAEAREWFEKAAAQEHSAALLALMRFADGGLAGPSDPKKGTEYCMRAARAGSALAMNEMGVRYQRGRGIGPDFVAAVGWFTVAAQYGQPAALTNLGNCYEVGNGARQDFEQAGRNYAAAAKMNFAPAQLLLGQMIEQGKGTAANLAHAYVLYTRAAAQKNEDAKKRADEIKPKLTPAQLEEAEKLLKSGAIP